MIASVSGIRGVLNQDITLEDFAGFAGNFALTTGSQEVLLARDTRKTGDAIRRAVSGALMSKGVDVVDFGIISTPALFRESRSRNRPAVMITASHNEPQFNGLKFIVGGYGVGRDAFNRINAPVIVPERPFLGARMKRRVESSYADDLVRRFGEGSCAGVKVALDLGGGAAISHAVGILRRLGCEVLSLNDTPGVFSRKVDPMADELALLQKEVKQRRFSIGLGFDSDGDRLAIVDSSGRKRSGDYMLTLALSHLMTETGEKKVVVSVDTTQAVDDVASAVGGRVYRAKVGEANVVAMMREEGARLGGEGSSGGLIDGSFNHCRDSMLAALVIISAMKRGGLRGDEVKSYHQARTAVQLERKIASRAIRTLAKRYPKADLTDGLKVWLSKKSWVLVRPSGTEDLVRVSAEAETAKQAAAVAKTFAFKLKELSR